MATQTAPLTHCPTCGVKLERPELSMCAYCASPLRVGPVEVPNDETQKRLAKVRSHADFAVAQRWLPIDPVFERKAALRDRLGWSTLALGLLLACGGWLLRDAVKTQSPDDRAWGALDVVALVGLVSVVVGVVNLWLAALARSEHRRAPMLKRAAYVLDRRSETNERGGIGSTTYVFKIRFEDGSEGEFSHVGRGSMYEPPANGAAGVAYTRGTRMLEFRRI